MLRQAFYRRQGEQEKKYLEKLVLDGDKKELISRLWRYSSAFSLICFFIYQFLIEVDSLYGKPICKQMEYSKLSWYMNLMQCGGLFTAICLLTIHELRYRFTNNATRYAFLTIFVCVSMSFTTHMLILTANWGGICVDSLGVATPAAIWGEWLFCTPLLMFLVVALENKPQLSRMDYSMIVFQFLSVLFGFLIIFEQPKWAAGLWLALSGLCFLTVYKVFFDERKKFRKLTVACDQGNATATNKGYELPLHELELSTRKISICNVFVYLMPLYAVIYLLALFKALDVDATRVAFQFCDLLIKGNFCLIAVDRNIELLNTSTSVQLKNKHDNEARRAFLSYIIHEVRVPLNSLSMGIDFLTSCGNLSADQRESLVLMHEAAGFLGETLNEVLKMQKLEEGKFKLEFSFFSIRNSLKRVLDKFASILQKASVELDLNVQTELPPVLNGDSIQVESIIAIFVSNAIKSSPTDSTVAVKVTFKVDANSPVDTVLVTLSVTDSGPVITEKEQKRLFDSFLRIRPGELQQGRGSGFGLAICKQLAELHGGNVWCVSKGDIDHNRGELAGENTFGFTIPFKFSNDVLAEAENSSQSLRVGLGSSPDRLVTFRNSSIRHPGDYVRSHSGISRHSRGGDCYVLPFETNADLNENKASDDIAKATDSTVLVSTNSLASPGNSPSIRRIMVVDDVMSNRKLLKMLLEKKGLLVDTANDGSEALALIGSNPGLYSMIFMDYLMPVMSGPKACRVMRAREFDRLIVGVTGCAMDDDVQEYVGAGADLVAAKPLSMPLLNCILAHVLEHGSGSMKGFKLSVVGVGAMSKLIWVPRE